MGDILDFDLLDYIQILLFDLILIIFNFRGAHLLVSCLQISGGVWPPGRRSPSNFFFWKSSKLNKEFNETIPRPPSGLESPQNWVFRYVVVKHAFFVFFDVHAHPM